MYLSCFSGASKRYFGYQWISAQDFPYSCCLLSGTRNNVIHSCRNSSLVCKLQQEKQNLHYQCILYQEESLYVYCFDEISLQASKSPRCTAQLTDAMWLGAQLHSRLSQRKDMKMFLVAQWPCTCLGSRPHQRQLPKISNELKPLNQFIQLVLSSCMQLATVTSKGHLTPYLWALIYSFSPLLM